jgi:protocatechuate 3,4-dioxygenase beta subunit
VRLSEAGQFAGQIVDAQGQPVADAAVELWAQGRIAGRGTTDPQGRFRFAGLRAGLYQVLAPGAAGVVRLWQPAVAPPAAGPALLLVQGSTVRGQYPPRQEHPPHGVYDGALKRTLGNPWVFAGLVAAGIAVPIALTNDDDRNGS